MPEGQSKQDGPQPKKKVTIIPPQSAEQIRAGLKRSGLDVTAVGHDFSHRGTSWVDNEKEKQADIRFGKGSGNSLRKQRMESGSRTLTPEEQAILDQNIEQHDRESTSPTEGEEREVYDLPRPVSSDDQVIKKSTQ